MGGLSLKATQKVGALYPKGLKDHSKTSTGKTVMQKIFVTSLGLLWEGNSEFSNGSLRQSFVNNWCCYLSSFAQSTSWAGGYSCSRGILATSFHPISVWQFQGGHALPLPPCQLNVKYNGQLNELLFHALGHSLVSLSECLIHKALSGLVCTRV